MVKNKRYELEINQSYCGCVMASSYSISEQNEFVSCDVYVDVYGIEFYDPRGEVVYFIDNCEFISVDDKDNIVNIDKSNR